MVGLVVDDHHTSYPPFLSTFNLDSAIGVKDDTNNNASSLFHNMF